MSIKLMSAAWEMDIPQAEKMVLLCLCDHANDTGECWPSVARLAQKCSVSDRTVQRSVRKLEEMGVLRVRQSRGKLANVYVIDLSQPRHSVTPTQCHPDTVSPPTPTQCRPNPDTVSPKPLRTTIEPSEAISAGEKSLVPMPDQWTPEQFGKKTECRSIVDSWSAEQLNHQIEKFKSHHTSKGSRFVDWQAAWKTWVLNSRSFGRADGKTGYRPRDNRDGLQRYLDERLGIGAD